MHGTKFYRWSVKRVEIVSINPTFIFDLPRFKTPNVVRHKFFYSDCHFGPDSKSSLLDVPDFSFPRNDCFDVTI